MSGEVLRALVAAGASPWVGLLVKATLIAGLGLATAGLARRQSAAVRHLILAAALGGLLLLPVAMLVVPAVRWAVPMAPAKAANAAASFSPLEVTDVPRADAAAATSMPVRPALPRPWWRRVSASEAVVSLWALGAAGFLAMFLAGIGEIRRLRRGAREGPPLGARVPAGVRILLHESAGPLTYGLLRPVIVLPSAAGAWAAADVERALTHELEHIRRRDWLTFCGGRAICALYWFHPLVWMLQRRMSLEAERACDDAVLRRADALAYADQLVGFAEGRALRPPLLALAGRGDLAGRVGAVLDGKRRRGRVGWGAAVAAAAATAVVTLAVSPLRAVAGAKQQPGLRFSVVSLKEWKPGQMPRRYAGVLRQDPGRVFGAYASLSEMISYAFNLTGTERVEGLPPWSGYKDFGRAIHFALDARMPASTTDAQTALMMQSLLRDRFGLAWHWTHERAKVLELVVAPGGLKLKRKDPGYPRLPSGTIERCPAGVVGCEFHSADSETMEDFAGGLSGFVGRPVVDKTGLPGRFFFPHFTLLSPIGATVPVPSVPTVLREVAGLTLRPATDTIPVLVIDHVVKPTANPGEDPAGAVGQAAGPAPLFEAVSIKPVKPNGRPFMIPTGWSPFLPGGRFSDPHTSLWMLINAAFAIPHPDFQTARMPAWAKSDLFAVDATPGNELRGLNAKAAHRQVLLMLQTMLAQRFGLRLHTVERPARILEMRLAGKALENVTQVSARGKPERGRWPGINVAAGDDGGRIIGNGASTGNIASGVATLLGTKVLDKTGVKGFYNFDIHWTAPPAPPGTPPPDPNGIGPSGRALLLSQLREQLGLRFVSVNGTEKVWVIDHLNRNPTPN